MCADSTIHSFSQHNVYVVRRFFFSIRWLIPKSVCPYRTSKWGIPSRCDCGPHRFHVGRLYGGDLCRIHCWGGRWCKDRWQPVGLGRGIFSGRQRRNFSKGKVQVVRDAAGSNRNFLGEQGKEPILPYGLSIMKGYLYCRTPSYGHHLCHHDFKSPWTIHAVGGQVSAETLPNDRMKHDRLNLQWLCAMNRQGWPHWPPGCVFSWPFLSLLWCRQCHLLPLVPSCASSVHWCVAPSGASTGMTLRIGKRRVPSTCKHLTALRFHELIFWMSWLSLQNQWAGVHACFCGYGNYALYLQHWLWYHCRTPFVESWLM